MVEAAKNAMGEDKVNELIAKVIPKSKGTVKNENEKKKDEKIITSIPNKK
jgi:hypothetical protein